MKDKETKKTVRRISILLLLLGICLYFASLLVHGTLSYVLAGLSYVASIGAGFGYFNSAKYWLGWGFELGARGLYLSGIYNTNGFMMCIFWLCVVGAIWTTFAAFLPIKWAVIIAGGLAIGSLYIMPLSPIGGANLWAFIGLLLLILLALLSGWAFWAALFMELLYMLFVAIQIFSPVTLTYAANGGEFADGATEQTITVAYGADLASVTVEQPTRVGYDFNAWNASGIVIKDAEISALWNTQSIVITYAANGGEFADGATERTITVAYGTDISSVTVEQPTRSGYTFIHFLNLGNTDIVTSSKTLIAIWDAENITFAVNFDANNGAFSNGNIITLNTRYPNSVAGMWRFGVPERLGYTLTGWNTKTDGTGENMRFEYQAYMPEYHDMCCVYVPNYYASYAGFTLYAVWALNSGA